MKLSCVNITGMHNIVAPTTVSLDNKLTYIFGKNGSGKSTIVEAIQLALLGYIPGYGKKNQDIMKHANGDMMSVEVVFDSGASVKRIYIKDKTSVKCTVVSEPEDLDLLSLIGQIELPVFNFNEFVGSSSNKQKEWFISYLPSSKKEVSWDNELAESIKNMMLTTDKSIIMTEAKEIIDNVMQTMKDDAPAAVVAEINKQFKAVVSCKKSKVDQLTSTYSSLTNMESVSSSAYMSSASIKEQMDTIDAEREDIIKQKAIAATYRVKTEQLSAYAALKATIDDDPRVSSIQAKEAGYDLDTRDIKAQQEELDKWLVETDPKLEEITKQKYKLEQYLSDLKNLIQRGSNCPYDKSPCERLAAKTSEHSAEYEEKNAEYIQVCNSYSQLATQVNTIRGNKHSLYEQLSDILLKQIPSLKKEYSNIKLEYRTRDALLKEINNMPSVPSEEYYDERINELNETKKKLNEEYTASLTQETNAELLDTVFKDKLLQSESLDCFKEWVKLTGPNGLQTSLSDDVFNEAETHMTEYIQKMFGKNYSAFFNVSQKANSFGFGLIVNKKRIFFETLSSGEKCAYVVALIAYLLERSSFKLALIDDIFDHLDPDNAVKCVKCINKLKDIQFAVTGFTDSEKLMNELGDNQLVDVAKL